MDPLKNNAVVNFLIAGAQKAGTTALYYFLQQHPLVRFPDGLKELHFFEQDENYFIPGTDRPNIAWYHSFFRHPPLPHFAVGEATPEYMCLPNALERIHAYNPQMQFIFMLRNPVERAYSQYWLHRRLGQVTESFEAAVATELEVLNRRESTGNPHFKNPYGFLEKGRYATHFKMTLRLFPREQCLYVRTERLEQEHDAVLTEVFKFLGLSGSVRIAPTRKNVSKYEPMSEKQRQFVYSLLAAEIDELEDLLGWDLSAWKA